MDKTVVELFAGVGGFHLGLTQASDFNIIWANQWEPNKKVQHAFDCYQKHFGEKTICANENIADVKKNIPDHTLLVGGFPCQDYSIASTGAKGIEGKKGVLWWEIRDILKDKKPPFILLENVDRLLKSPSTQKGRDFGIMLASLNDLGYSVEWRVINASEYGFAQRRKRVFVFAYYKDTKYYKEKNIDMISLIKKEGLFSKTVPVEQNFDHLECELIYSDLLDISNDFSFNFLNAGVMQNGRIVTAKTIPIYEKPKTLEEIMERNVDESFFIKNRMDRWEYLKGSKRIPRVSNTGHEYIYSEGAIAFPDPTDKPSRTLLTSESSLNRSTHVVEDLDTKKLRLLTQLECERLNGFDDNWTNTGMPQKFRYFCMGNALVVGLVERLGKGIAQIIENE